MLCVSALIKTLSTRGVPVRALGTRAGCVPVTSGTDGHSGSLAVDENAVPPGARRCHLHRKDA